VWFNAFSLDLVLLCPYCRNGYKLDRSHIFALNVFDEFDTFMKVPDEWAPPESKPYTPGVIASISLFHVFCHWS